MMIPKELCKIAQTITPYESEETSAAFCMTLGLLMMGEISPRKAAEYASMSLTHYCYLIQKQDLPDNQYISDMIEEVEALRDETEFDYYDDKEESLDQSAYEMLQKILEQIEKTSENIKSLQLFQESQIRNQVSSKYDLEKNLKLVLNNSRYALESQVFDVTQMGVHLHADTKYFYALKESLREHNGEFQPTVKSWKLPYDDLIKWLRMQIEEYGWVCDLVDLSDYSGF